MEMNADLNQRVVLETSALAWSPSPMPGVEQRLPGRKPVHHRREVRRPQQAERTLRARYNLLQLQRHFVTPMADPTPRFGFVEFAETWNGRLAMLGFVIGLGTELLTGQGILSQIGLG